MGLREACASVRKKGGEDGHVTCKYLYEFACMYYIVRCDKKKKKKNLFYDEPISFVILSFFWLKKRR